jgi:hypothetical protein
MYEVPQRTLFHFQATGCRSARGVGYCRARPAAQDLIDEPQMSAQMYQDANWNWNPWGPWAPGFGFAYYGAGW